jgi:hypothetical protein
MASLIMWRDLTTKQRYELYQQYRKSNPNMKYSDMEKDFNDWYNNLTSNNKGDIKTGGYVIPYINGKYDTELAYKESEPTVILPEVTVTARKPEKPTIDDTSLLKGHNPVSIEPSDAFFAGDMLKVKPNKATLISGNTDALTKFRKAGGNIYSTEELRRLYNEAINEGLNKSSLWDDYENALHNTYRKRSGNWKMKDVELLEDVTGLGRESSKTFSRSEYEALMQKGRSLDNKPKQSIIDIYSNSEKRSRLEDTKLNFGEVMYDPMSSIEDMMRQKWGIDLKNNKSN